MKSDPLDLELAGLIPSPDTYRIAFTVPGVPVAWGRAGVTTRQAKSFAQHYTPKKTRRYEASVRAAGMAAMGTLRPCRDAVQMTLVAFVPIPKSWSRRKRAQALAGLVYPLTRPDLDNYEKAVADALNGVVYVDDSQICDVVKSKRYSDEPRVSVTFNSINGFSTYELQPVKRRTRHAKADR